MDEDAVLHLYSELLYLPYVFIKNGDVHIYTIRSMAADNSSCGCLTSPNIVKNYGLFHISYYEYQAWIHNLYSTIIISKTPVYNIYGRITTHDSHLCSYSNSYCLNSLHKMCENSIYTLKLYLWKHLYMRINILSSYDILITDIRDYIANMLSALYVRDAVISIL
jgi:hypothetical protein